MLYFATLLYFVHARGFDDAPQELTCYVEPDNKMCMAFKVLKLLQKKHLKIFKNL